MANLDFKTLDDEQIELTYNYISEEYEIHKFEVGILGVLAITCIHMIIRCEGIIHRSISIVNKCIDIISRCYGTFSRRRIRRTTWI